MRKNVKKTFPKEADKKLKETIQKLKARIKYLEKKIKFLENELLNVVKPIRRKPRTEESKQEEMTREEWRKDFLKRFRQSLTEPREKK